MTLWIECGIQSNENGNVITLSAKYIALPPLSSYLYIQFKSTSLICHGETRTIENDLSTNYPRTSDLKRNL